MSPSPPELFPAGLVLVSGGQTGVDRAALDFALGLGAPHGGWCPRGRRAEDGVLDARYALWETESRDYAVRTRRNVELADATLLCTSEPALSGGTRLTREHADEVGRPWFHHTPERDVDDLRRWLRERRVRVLNVAGPRASGSPAAAVLARETLAALSLAPPVLAARHFLWAIPAREQRVPLQAAIDALAAGDGAPPFVPHVTLASADGPAPALGEPSGAALRFEVLGVETSTLARRTLTVELRARGAFPGVDIEAIGPHLSLSYTTPDLDLGAEVLGRLGDTLVCDALWAVHHGAASGAAPAPRSWTLAGLRPM